VTEHHLGSQGEALQEITAKADGEVDKLFIFIISYINYTEYDRQQPSQGSEARICSQGKALRDITTRADGEGDENLFMIHYYYN
jgi:hypothetical protein